MNVSSFYVTSVLLVFYSCRFMSVHERLMMTVVLLLL